MFTACGIMHRRCCQLVGWMRWNISSTSSSLPAGSIVGALYHKQYTQSSAPEDGRNYRPKHVELIGIINKPLLLHLVVCLYDSTLDVKSCFENYLRSAKYVRSYNYCQLIG